jgi:geranylgeranyl diphosphate synthase type I
MIARCGFPILCGKRLAGELSFISLQDSHKDSILGVIEKIWDEASAWPEFTRAMRLALTSGKSKRDTSKWAKMPGLCCQAAGGDPLNADPIAAAWLLFYAAASIMDHVEDMEEPDPWWAELGAGAAINVATGLYFSACQALNHLDSILADQNSANAIRTSVLQHFLVMCSGQHRDLVQVEPTLEQYWEIAQAKSGAFFKLACWGGARLATNQIEVLDGFSQFGQNVGLLVQISDDLEDLQEPEKRLRQGNAASLSRSLPVTYVREVCQEPVKDQLKRLLSQAELDPGATKEILQIVESNGGLLYLLTEIEKHRRLALEGLEQIDADQPAKQILVSLLDFFIPAHF